MDSEVGDSSKRSTEAEIALVIVDQQRRVLRGLAMRLAIEPDLRVLAVLNEIQGLQSRLTGLQPDALLLDGGLVSDQRQLLSLRESFPKLVVIVHELHSVTAGRRRALAAAADGFLIKQDTGDALPDTIRNLVHTKRGSGSR